MSDTLDIAAWAASLNIRHTTARIRRPLTVTPVVTDVGVAQLQVDGDCEARCNRGFTFELGDDGNTYARPCPSCTQTTEHARRFNAAALPGWAHQVRGAWSGERTWPQVEALARHLVSGEQIARVYYGDPGRGKSYLAAALALLCIEAGVPTRWVTWPDLLSSLKDQLRDDKPLRTIIEPISRAELLVVDEVKGIATPFSSDVAELLIGRRAELGRRILITANLDDGQLWEYLGDRVRSRLTMAGKTMEITGEDRRAAPCSTTLSN